MNLVVWFRRCRILLGDLNRPNLDRAKRCVRHSIRSRIKWRCSSTTRIRRWPFRNWWESSWMLKDYRGIRYLTVLFVCSIYIWFSSFKIKIINILKYTQIYSNILKYRHGILQSGRVLTLIILCCRKRWNGGPLACSNPFFRDTCKSSITSITAIWRYVSPDACGRLDSIQFDPIRFGSIRFDSERYLIFHVRI